MRGELTKLVPGRASRSQLQQFLPVLGINVTHNIKSFKVSKQAEVVQIISDMHRENYFTGSEPLTYIQAKSSDIPSLLVAI